MPLQGQKNVEVKEEKNDEKNLYRDISTSHFREINLFEESTFSSSGKFRRFSFLEKMTFLRNREFREIDFFDESTFSRKISSF